MKKLPLFLLLLSTLSFSQVTSVAALTIGTSGTDVNSTVATSTTTPAITLNIPNAGITARGLVTNGMQTFAGLKTFTGAIISHTIASEVNDTPFYIAAIAGKKVPVGKTFDIFKAWGNVTGSSLSGITHVGLGVRNDISGMPTPFLALGRDNKQNIYLFSKPAAFPDGVSQINSRLQVGYDQWSPDTNNANTLAVNGNISAKGISIENNNIITFEGPNLANSLYGWGIGNGSWDSRPNDALGKPYIMQHHNGLSFNAHSYYGGIRFYNQGYPSVYDSELVMSIVDNAVGIGTTTPKAKLDVEGGDFYLGENVASDGNRREFRVYGFDNGSKFYGSSHANYDNDKRTFEISTSSQTQQLKFDASSNANGFITLWPGTSAGVGIGTLTTGSHKLAVEGTIGAREVKVYLGAWSDFVFKKDYNLPTLLEVETHIKDKGHLKDIPSEKEVVQNGVDLGEMNAKLLQKVEELTLYAIDQDKKLTAFEKEIAEMKTQVKAILAKK